MFTRRRNNSLLGRLLAAVSRLCLTLALWHAPFPVLHAHTFAVERVARDAWLQHHVEEFHVKDFHGATHDHEDDHSGWHVHLMLMQDVCPCEEHQTGHAPKTNGGPAFKMAVPATTVSLACGAEWPALDILPVDHAAPVLSRLSSVVLGTEGLSPGGSFSHICTLQGSLSLHALLAHRVC